MNIFVTSFDPVKAARYLDDQRIIKMMTESVQMLSTACRVMGIDHPSLFRKTHENHPCSVWVRAGRDNFSWLHEHALALQDEWRRRWNHKKTSRSIERFKEAKGLKCLKLLPSCGTPFVNCAANSTYGLDFKHLEIRKAYRMYLKARWSIQQAEFPRTRLPMCSIKWFERITDVE